MNKYGHYGNGKTSLYTLAGWLKGLQPFRAANNQFRGESFPQLSGDTGALFYDEALYESFKKDQREFMIDYIVYSYHTPIAWHHKAHGWIENPNTYSKTTADHKSAVRAALSVM